ncbi:unnamed protein product [Adineta ricciae]|uniref:Uncharacterized protein n=1 Tax=Adineta ricciae TaxID=249248 RepID=A0A814A8W3_ADIRI|nr:unnamed protein product [Adineta ricciae]
MRYFVYYPPKDSMRLIDVTETARVEDILTLVKKEFDLNAQDSSAGEISIVLSYNGSDLKPKWSLAELSIPSGSIIRCLYREKKAADLYVHCSYNKQIYKLFDSNISIDTTIGNIRKILSNRLGLPLSVFCLETYDGKQRLYDRMKLFDYDLKPHAHLYLKVWQGYDKLIDACVKGFTGRYAHDDLSRHYQIQIALHIAAFHGHMELANTALQQGARSDRPVGEHPSRQWSSEAAQEAFPEMLKCPIHIAVERGHVKLVDLFVRQSILCTQIRDPITDSLPYMIALGCSLLATTKQDKQRYRVIYYYLYDKQYNMKIPLNSTAEYIADLLSSNISAGAIHHKSTNLIYVSVPLYYRIIRWCERAREKTWKKYGGQFMTSNQNKRVYPLHGLLGYKVLIDGFNNTFETPEEQLRHVRKSAALKSNESDRYLGFSAEERQKIFETKLIVQDIALSERKRAKQIAAENLRHTRRPPVLLSSPRKSIYPNKQQPSIISDSIYSSSSSSNNQKQSNITVPELRRFESFPENDNTSTNDFTSSVLFNAPTRIQRIEDERKSALKSFPSIPAIVINEEKTTTLPPITPPLLKASISCPSLAKKSESIRTMNKPDDHPVSMSSADAYGIASLRINQEFHQGLETKRQQLYSRIKQSVDDIPNVYPQKSTNRLSVPKPIERQSIDIDTYIPLPDQPSLQRLNPIKSHIDVNIRQSTVQPYERYASASTRSTAVHCLEEAAYFKRKSWLKQVEISKEMVKNQVKRRIRRADKGKVKLIPIRTISKPTTSD